MKILKVPKFFQIGNFLEVTSKFSSFFQNFNYFFKFFPKFQFLIYLVKVAMVTHDHDDTPQAILTLIVVPAGK